MSTNNPTSDGSSPEWISQAEAARLHGVSRQAINRLVKKGRLRALIVGGHVLVNREDVIGFRPDRAGRPSPGDSRIFDRITKLLDSCDQPTLARIDAYLQARRPLSPIERRLGAPSGLILGALGRSGALTTRMIRGIIAEAAFDFFVVRELLEWTSESITGNPPYDFLLSDAVGSIRVQVKLQRSAKGVPARRGNYFLVETQRTRGGTRRVEGGGGQRNRPYRFGEFDLLAVCLQPSTGQWADFRYTVADWLCPSPTNDEEIATLQPLAVVPNEDWSADPRECIGRFRRGEKRRIAGGTEADT